MNNGNLELEVENRGAVTRRCGGKVGPYDYGDDRPGHNEADA